MKPELDGLPLVNIDIATSLIIKIEPRKETKFKDPFVYIPNQDEDGQNTQATEELKNVIPS